MSNGNANYSRIQAHGTSSAFEPGFIQQAGSVGPYLRPQESPFNLINANCNLVGSKDDDILVVGDALAPGCTFTQVTLNGNDSVEANFGVQFGFAELNPVTGSLTNYQNVQTPSAAAATGVAGQDLNGGEVFVLSSSITPVLVPVTAGNVMVPVLHVETPVTDPMTQGSVNVTAVYVCP